MRLVPGRRIRGVGYIVLGVLSVALVVYLLADPASLAGAHPLPLVSLLLLSTLVALLKARELLR